MESRDQRSYTEAWWLVLDELLTRRARGYFVTVLFRAHSVGPFLGAPKWRQSVQVEIL